jgi:CDP-glucose 4,6-dehydratase
MKALMDGRPIGVRNPLSVRPWQHVLEPLSGYLWLGVQLLGERPGPAARRGTSARWSRRASRRRRWPRSWSSYGAAARGSTPGRAIAEVETGLLRLSWDKAAHRLNWRPVYAWVDALGEITDWFKAFQAGEDMGRVTRDHIGRYTARAAELGLPWAEES